MGEDHQFLAPALSGSPCVGVFAVCQFCDGRRMCDSPQLQPLINSLQSRGGAAGKAAETNVRGLVAVLVGTLHSDKSWSLEF